MIDWLRASDSELAHTVADRVEQDAWEYSQTVDAEVAELYIGGPDDVVVATNESLRQGRLRCRSGGGPWRTIPVQHPARTGDYRMDEAPIGTLEGLEDVLRATAELFPPERHRYVLLLKSHAQEGYVAVPRLSIRHEDVTPEELLAILHDETARAPRNESAWVSRRELFDLLAALGKETDMIFPLVVLESCHSGVGLSADELPTSVDAVAATLGEAAYHNFDLASLGMSEQDLADLLLAQVRRTSPFAVTERPVEADHWSLAPLGLVLLLALRTVVRAVGARRRAVSPAQASAVLVGS